MLFLLLSVADAVLPLPTYPECGVPDRDDLCPSDLEHRWRLISYIPEGSRDTIRPAEAGMASGASAAPLRTAMPTVNTRKKVPMNSTRYFFMEELDLSR